MIIIPRHPGVKRALDDLVKKPRDGITVTAKDNVYRVEFERGRENPLLDLAHAVPGLSSNTAEIKLG